MLEIALIQSGIRKAMMLVCKNDDMKILSGFVNIIMHIKKI